MRSFALFFSKSLSVFPTLAHRRARSPPPSCFQLGGAGEKGLDPITLRNASYASSEEICQYISALGISKVSLLCNGLTRACLCEKHRQDTRGQGGCRHLLPYTKILRLPLLIFRAVNYSNHWLLVTLYRPLFGTTQTISACGH